MRPTQRRIDPGVIQALLDAPQRFAFFQAVRVLENWLDGAGTARQGSALEHRIAFRNTLSLSFPPSEIERLQAHDTQGAALPGVPLAAQATASGATRRPPDAARAPLAPAQIARIDLTPAFFGLLGTQGALPLHYTEHLLERESLRRDGAAREFLDIFSNRATALFYRAWKKYRLPFGYESQREAQYTPLLLALAGIDPSAADALGEGQGGLHADALAGYASAARQRPMSAAYLKRVLSDYFAVPVDIEHFVGDWYTVPTAQLSRLGGANAVLGATALAGKRVWQRDMCVGLTIGPLDLATYREFLRDGPRARALARLLQLTAGVLVEYRITLVLRREDVHAARLGMTGRLGQDAFLCTRASPVERGDARYRLPVMV